MLCLVTGKFKGKYKEKKIERKKKMKEKKLKLINYFYILLKTHLTYYNSSI